MSCLPDTSAVPVLPATGKAPSGKPAKALNAVPVGSVRLVLYDDRAGSATNGLVQEVEHPVGGLGRDGVLLPVREVVPLGVEAKDPQLDIHRVSRSAASVRSA